MFIEVIVLDAFNKTPVAMDPTDQFNFNYYVTLEIKDPAGTSIFTNYDYIKNMSVTFAYKVPDEAAGGEYTIKVANQY
jgi:hypothetical protein